MALSQSERGLYRLQTLHSHIIIAEYSAEKIIISDSCVERMHVRIKGAFHYAKRTGQRLVEIQEENGTTFSD